MKNYSLSISIVNYNTKTELEKCLKSILENPPGCRYEIHVIDNNSSDGSCQMIKEKFPNIQLIENKSNEGFARANNKVIKQTRSDYILILNPDTLVLRGSLDLLLNYLEKNPKIAIAAPKLINSKRHLLSSCEMFPSLKGELIQSFYLDKIWPLSKWASRYTLNRWPHNKTREVDWLTGACLMVRRKAIEDVGLMDEKYFLYYEDVDWCYHMKEKNWQVHFYPEAQIIHHQGRSTKAVLDKTIFISHKSKYHFLKTHYPAEQLDRYKKIIDWGIRLRLIIWTLGSLFDIKNKKTHRFRLQGYSKALNINFTKKIAIDVTSFSRIRAGVEFYINNITSAIERIDNKITSFIRLDISQTEDKSAKPSLWHKITRAFNVLYQVQIRLPFLLKHRKMNLLHSPAYITPLVKFCPTIVTIHDLSFMLFPEMFVSTYRLYLKIFVPLSVRRADLVIADSENTKKDIVDLLKIPPKKIKVVYPGVEDRFYYINNPKEIKAFLQKYNLPDEFILFVGTLEPRKNLTGLLKAYHIYCQKVPQPLKLVLTGMKGWLYSDIFDLIDNLGLRDKVIFTDYLPDEDMPLLYNAAKLLVYPSFYEGFGFPVIEAMACGTPVIASDVSSLPEVVGNAGILIDPSNSKEIAHSISKVLENDEFRNNLIDKGLKQAKKFSWDKSAKETIQVYDECLKDKYFCD